MDKRFQIGSFCFRLVCPIEVPVPENFLKFEQIRIALYQANGRPNDTRRWARELVKTLSSKYQIPCRVDIRGLGKAVVMIGEK